MPAQDVFKFLERDEGKAKWYQVERNTAALLQAVVSAKRGESLSGTDIWHLLQLTWDTNADDHWRRLKIPALGELFEQDKTVQESSRSASLKEAVDALSLPKGVAEAAGRHTGNISLYKAFRNSSQDWCRDHERKLREIIRDAIRLEANDRGRLQLAAKVEALHRVPTPKGAHHMNAGGVLTPLIAFLDPRNRFPIVNGREEVRSLLGEWGLKGRSLEEQVRGMLGSIGRSGIRNAFVLDIMAEKIREIASDVNIPVPVKTAAPTQGSALPDLDTSDLEYLRKVGTALYRQRHNKMTTALKKILHGFRLTQGTKPDCRWDVLVEGYETTGRDLLLEVKPDPERAAIRIAIGQLLDYRRFVPRPAATDIAVLTIGAPDELYRQLLLELQISSIWFTDEDCRDFDGEGLFWEALRKSLVTRKDKPRAGGTSAA